MKHILLTLPAIALLAACTPAIPRECDTTQFTDHKGTCPSIKGGGPLAPSTPTPPAKPEPTPKPPVINPPTRPHPGPRDC